MLRQPGTHLGVRRDGVPRMKLGRRLAKGAVWTVTVRFALRFIGLISTVILARLLTPADFGIVALAATVTAALQMWTAFGFELVLIREENPTPERYSAVWTLSVLRGLLIAAATLAIAPWASDFLNEPRLAQVFPVIALAPLIQGFHNVGIVDFRKHLEFDREFHYLVTARVLEFVVTLALALWWRSYWALIAGMVMSQVFKLVLSYTMHPFRPRPTLAGVRSIISFSSWLLMNGILQFIINKSDKLFVARLVGTAEVGLYSIAYEVSNLATSELIMPIRRVMLPGFSKVLGDRKALRRLYLDAFGLMILLGAPIAAWIAAVAEPLVAVVLGDQWGAVVPLLQILAVCGVIRVIGANSAPLFVAIGKPYITTVRLVITAAVAVPLLYYLTAAHGAFGTALAVTATAVLSQALNVFAAARELQTGLSMVLAQMWRTVLASSLMYAIVTELITALPAETWLENAAALIAAAIAGGLTLVGASLALWIAGGRSEGPEAIVMREAGGRLPAVWRSRLLFRNER